MEDLDTYAMLLELLNQRGARYRLIDHPPEGRTEFVSLMRGNELSDAAKCMVLIVKLGKKTTKYVLAVVPGDKRVSLTQIKTIFGATYASFATAEVAEKLAGSVRGTILPFSFTPELELVVDASLAARENLYFNAARLDRSIELKAQDYISISHPRVERIIEMNESL